MPPAPGERHAVPGTGLRVVTPDTFQLAEDSPTHLKLLKAVEALSLDERMDLLVLGWVGDGQRHTRRRLFDFAMRSSSDIRYIAELGMRWREGLRRWSTWDRTMSSRVGVPTGHKLRPPREGIGTHRSNSTPSSRAAFRSKV